MSIEINQRVNLSDYEIDQRIVQILPEEVVRRLKMLPIKVDGGQLQVAAKVPLNIPGLDEIKLLTGLKVKPVIVSEQEIDRAINDQFNTEKTSKQAIVDMTFQELGSSKFVVPQDDIIDVEEAPVVALVNSIIRGAVNDNASDIHLEPQFPEMVVRYRINGLLHDVNHSFQNI